MNITKLSDKNKIKLVIFSAFYEPYMSGAEQMAREIAQRLGRKYEITLITGRYDKNLLKKEKRQTFTLIRVGVGNKLLDKLLYPILAARQTSWIKPDIAHAIMESYAGGALALLKYFYPHARRVLTLQSGDLDDHKKQKQFLIKIFFKKIHQSPHIVTAISSFLAKRAEKIGVPQKRIRIIPNGVDLSKVPENTEKIAGRVICVARLSWEKGLNYLIKAWPKVKKEASQARLVIVGEGGKRDEIEKLIQDFDISNSVVLTGNLPHKQVLAELKKSEIFILPSLAEGLGIVLIEAQACGIPVIGTRVGGIPDVISDGNNGLLIEPKNSEEISSAIIKLLKDKELSCCLVARATETVKRYDWQAIIGKIDKLYDEINC